jgi:hypothetical protein
MKLVPIAQRLYNILMDELDERDSSRTSELDERDSSRTSGIYEENFFSDEDKYHILRYLTNMLETEESQLYKKLNENQNR